MATDSELDSLIRPMPRATYEVDVHFNSVERMLDELAQPYGLNLDPDFQRGHVWTELQQQRWIESVLRGAVSGAGLTIQFNAPQWNSLRKEQCSDMSPEVVIVDGLQRLTALRRYVANEIQAFGRFSNDFAMTPYDTRRYRLKMAVFEFQSRADLLQYYLDINSGGTPHAQSEIDRVTALLQAAKQKV